MKIYPTLMLAALMLSGCAATPAPVQGYRPANHNGPPWEISGSYNEFSGKIIILINGEKITEGSMSIMTGRGDFSGHYNEKPISVSCSTTSGFLTAKTQCMVFVGNERAAILQF